ncbi:MAG: hypothetical protein HYW07_11320 [Candidatus Latescibacteria bacterium]|nr:hypothetical protein [Candidatus Latescibacterota bacterium]
MNRPTFKDYAAQESEKLLNGERLLAPAQVMERLTITRKQLQALHRGVHPRGLFLPAYRLGKKTMLTAHSSNPLPAGRCAAAGVGLSTRGKERRVGWLSA